MKKLSKALWVVISIVLVLAVIALVLGLVKTNTVKPISDYSVARIYKANATSFFELNRNDTEDKAKDKVATLDKGLKKSRYSILHGIFEGRANSDYKFERETEKNDDGKYDAVEKTIADVLSLSTNDTEYRIDFEFDHSDGLKTITVEGEKISYDYAIVMVKATSDEIGYMTAYFFDNSYKHIYELYGANPPGDYDLAVHPTEFKLSPVKIRMIGTNIYNAVDTLYKGVY